MILNYLIIIVICKRFILQTPHDPCTRFDDCQQTKTHAIKPQVANYREQLHSNITLRLRAQTKDMVTFHNATSLQKAKHRISKNFNDT